MDRRYTAILFFVGLAFLALSYTSIIKLCRGASEVFQGGEYVVLAQNRDCKIVSFPALPPCVPCELAGSGTDGRDFYSSASVRGSRPGLEIILSLQEFYSAKRSRKGGDACNDVAFKSCERFIPGAAFPQKDRGLVFYLLFTPPEKRGVTGSGAADPRAGPCL